MEPLGRSSTVHDEPHIVTCERSSDKLLTAVFHIIICVCSFIHDQKHTRDLKQIQNCILNQFINEYDDQDDQDDLVDEMRVYCLLIQHLY